jgi:hypothetical protein
VGVVVLEGEETKYLTADLLCLMQGTLIKKYQIPTPSKVRTTRTATATMILTFLVKHTFFAGYS